MENEEQQYEKTTGYSKGFEQQKSTLQTAIYVMWKVHHKEYQVGSRLFYEQIESKIKTSKAAYKEALAFLEGASIVVNEVVIADKVSPDLIKRYEII